jgi:hypothetical protein
MRLILIIILSFSMSACTAKDTDANHLKQAVAISIRLLKLDAPIYLVIKTDTPDDLHHEIFVSTLVKIGTINDYVKALNIDYKDSNYFSLGDINAMCLAANYVLNYAKHEYKFNANLQKSIEPLKSQQKTWIERLKQENSTKIFGESDCLRTIK